jgi:carboxymethylenebutenolidase
MSSSRDLSFGALTRRDFLAAGAAIAVLPTVANAQGKPLHDAINDPNIIKGKVEYDSGTGRIDAYMSRPKEGRHPAVIVVAGNAISEEYILNTTALLAQAGFVGIAPNIFRLQTDRMTPQEKLKMFRTKITDDLVLSDLDATLKFLHSRPFVRRGKSGVMGFCFGGRISLMYAAHSREIGAVVPYYGNLVAPPEANRHQDPVDIVDKIRAPVQGHYSTRDDLVPLDKLHEFEASLRKHAKRVEFYEYEADHGFFSHSRRTFDPAAAELAWSRTVTFLKETLG